MSSLKMIALLCALHAVAIYYLYEPLPTCLNDAPAKLRIGLLMKPLVDKIADVVEFSGLMTRLQFQRKLLRMSQKREADNEQLISVDKDFDGVPVRVYLPTGRDSHGPAVFFMHGGAMVLSSVDSCDATVRSLATQLNMVTVSVDYPLAPEFPFPAAVNDVERAFRYFAKHASDFDVDASRIAVAGDSAGGTLATVLAIRIRNAAESNKETSDEPRVKLQILIYPVTQFFELASASRLINPRDFFVPARTLDSYRLQYILGNEYQNATVSEPALRYLHEHCYEQRLQSELAVAYKSKKSGQDLRQLILTDRDRMLLQSVRMQAVAQAKCSLDPQQLVETERRLQAVFTPDVSPILTPSLQRLPPTYVVSAGLDSVRDDALLYVERLREADVFVHHKHFEQECHAFMNFGKVDKVLRGFWEMLAIDPTLL